MSHISKEQLNYIVLTRPECSGSNTNFLQAFYEIACQARDIPATWENIKALMNEYKPEYVMRKRRQLVNSTEDQFVEEEKYRGEFTPDHC